MRKDRIVSDDVELEPRVGLAEDLPQQLRRGRAPTCTDLARSAPARTRPGPSSFVREASRPRVGPARDIAHPRRRGGELTEVEGLLAGREPLAGSHQQKARVQHRCGLSQRVRPPRPQDTNWEAFERGRDPRCANCMAHCGYEPTAVLTTMSSLRETIRGAVS
jgi:hypothetical protein